jgi:hypothetical protein
MVAPKLLLKAGLIASNLILHDNSIHPQLTHFLLMLNIQIPIAFCLMS